MISNKIRELRIKKGISQKDLAKILELSQQAVAKWENGKSEPNIVTLKKLSVIFEIDITYLIEEDELSTSESDDIAQKARCFEKLLLDNSVISENYTKENLDVIVDFLRANKNFLEPQLNKKKRTSKKCEV